MELSIFTVVILSILWLNVGIRATREFNDIDNDAMDWLTFPFILKVLVILAAPIWILIFDRHILETKRK